MIRVLICDDQDLVCEGLRAILSTAPEIEVVGVAFDGAQALEMIPRLMPDLVLMDLKMPGMNGIETLKRIREMERQLPIIMCSAYGEYKQDLTTWASDAYVVKCADLTELKSTIRRLLGPL